MSQTAPKREYVTGRTAKAERADEMLEAYNNGMSPREIAADFNVTARCVYVRLGENGVIFDNAKRQSEAFWSLPEDERRLAFARKAAEGARKTRLSNNRVIPTVHRNDR